jgi:hypothetical protein
MPWCWYVKTKKCNREYVFYSFLYDVSNKILYRILVMVKLANCNVLTISMTYAWYCHVLSSVITDGFLTGELDILITYTRHLELQVTTALSLISTLHKVLQPACLDQPFPSNGFNSGDSSNSVLTSLLSGQYPSTELLSTVNSSLRGLPYRHQLNCQTSTIFISRPGVLAIYPQGGPNRKHHLQQSPYCCHGLLPSDSPDIVSAGMCSPSRCSETSVCLFANCIATAVFAVCIDVFA